MTQFHEHKNGFPLKKTCPKKSSPFPPPQTTNSGKAPDPGTGPSGPRAAHTQPNSAVESNSWVQRKPPLVPTKTNQNSKELHGWAPSQPKKCFSFLAPLATPSPRLALCAGPGRLNARGAEGEVRGQALQQRQDRGLPAAGSK